MKQRCAERGPQAGEGPARSTTTPTRWAGGECEVLDISRYGVGLVVRHRRPSELVSHEIQVQVPARTGSLSACLQGTVRNTVITEPGYARVGIEFSGLTRAEEALAIVLDAWTRTQLERVPSRGQNLIRGRCRSGPRSGRLPLESLFSCSAPYEPGAPRTDKLFV
jgi:PilZ domain